MRLGVAVNYGVSPKQLEHIARLTDELEYEVLFAAEMFDQFAALAACARATERLQLATGIACVFGRNPVSLAAAAVTVDELTDGRFILGLGVGHRENTLTRDDVEPSRALPWKNGLRRMRETAEIVRTFSTAAYEGKTVDYTGKLFTVAGLEPRIAASRPTFPIWISAFRPKGLEMGGAIGDGVIASIMPDVSISPYFNAHINDGALDAGRDPSSINRVVYVLTCVDDDERSAREAVARRLVAYLARLVTYQEYFTGLGFGEVVTSIRDITQRPGADRARTFQSAARLIPDELLSSVAAWGTAKSCVRALERFSEAGVLPVVDLTYAGFAGVGPDPRACAEFCAGLSKIAEARAS